MDDSDNILMMLASQEAEHDLTMMLASQQESDEAEIDSLMIQASQQVEQQIEVEEDDLLMQASLQFEQQQSTEDSLRSKRFGSPVSSEKLLEKVEQTVPTCTRANTKWAVSTWNDWRANRRGDNPPELIDITNQQLSEWLLSKLGDVMARSTQGTHYTISVLVYREMTGFLRMVM